MKNNKIIIALGLVLTLTACDQNASKTAVSEETISQALDGPVENQDIVDEKQDQTEETQTNENEDKNDATDLNKWRDMILNIGEFSPTLVKNLTDDDLEKLIEDANQLSEETGYWDAKDFVFQELAKMYPELANKFPLDSVENRYNQEAAEEGDYNGTFDYERQLMIDMGYPSNEVWAIDDKSVQDAFHEAYEDDIDLYYEDYVENAASILFGEDEEDDDDQAESSTEDQKSENTSSKNKIKKYGSSQTDYDAIKASLVQYYEFSPASVNQMTNNDIDIAYTRAMARLEETGTGDIGLIFEELGNMFPGSSKMYPGEQTEEN
ncbi:hypothetical protein [Anaerococcus sp. Marseille-Q5996]|uniref:hypothetical protein n=1 Tax=Anaerococcus sp. Marseille-Q5996 TaxID=2972769 RepID=UPI0021C88D49|nr:hypothetical protein [Anaerococcus sp. Marseille-Q5996]